MIKPLEISACRDAFASAIDSQAKISALTETLKSCLSYINTPMFKNGMNPLHYAAEKGKINWINTLLKAGSHIDAQDKDGLSPLLISAIHGNAYATQNLLEKGANGTMLSKFGGNFADYLRITAPITAPNVQINNLISSNYSYSTPAADSVTVAPKCFKKDVRLTHENVAHPKVLDPLVRERLSDRDSYIETLKLMMPEQFRSYFLNNYEIYKKNPPALAISTVTKNDNNKPLSLNMCGMFAKEKISKGSIISEYTGEIKPDNYANSFFSQVDDTYLVGLHPVVDSIKHRSAASMSNHGFPNSQLLSLGKGDLDQGLDGLPFRHVLVAIDDIAEGEEIIWNYGAHYPSSGFSEPRPKGLEQFLKNTSWKEIIQALKEFGSTEIAKENLIDIFNKVYKFKYFVESPQAMKFAIEHKYLEKKHLRLLEKASNNDSFPPLSRALLTQFVERAKSQFKNKREL